MAGSKTSLTTSCASAVLSGLIAWLFSTCAVFLQVPVLDPPRRDRCDDHSIQQGGPPPRARHCSRRTRNSADRPARLALLHNRSLLVFAACSFLYELADAPLLTLVGRCSAPISRALE